MLKKIFLWTLYLIFVGILILGAINRTTVKIVDNDRGQTSSQDSPVDYAPSQLGEINGSKDDQNSDHDTPESDWLTFTGTVLSIIPRGMVVADTDGHLIEVARRAWRFAQEQGFSPQIGDQITLDGFYENGVFEAACITDLDNGQSVCLRDETGHPLWGSEEHE
ncbi:MAG: hypothetical protein ABFS03_12265 [Chloroflexota bacterium]